MKSDLRNRPSVCASTLSRRVIRVARGLTTGKVVTRGELRRLQQANPELSLSIEVDAGGKRTLLVTSQRQAGRATSGTAVRFDLKEVEGGFQLTGGKGIQRILKKPIGANSDNIVIPIRVFTKAVG